MSLSPAQGGAVPPAWADAVVLVFTSYKPDGTVADEIFRACGPRRCADQRRRR